MELLVLVVICILAGCTTITSVGGGTTPDNFYVVVNRGFWLFHTQNVLQCDRPDEVSAVECRRLLAKAQAREFMYVVEPMDRAYLACADQADADWEVLDEPAIAMAVKGFGARDGDSLALACMAGYARSWNAWAIAWNRANPSDLAPMAELPALPGR